MARLLGSRTTYGLLVMTELGRNYGQDPVSLSRIASSFNLPLSYLEQLMIGLRKACLVLAKRGKEGGYALSRRPDLISVTEILEALEGPIQMVGCQSNKGCPLTDSCGMCSFWLDFQRKVHRSLREKTLADLLSEKRRGSPTQLL
jgi:Rrf2 family protein